VAPNCLNFRAILALCALPSAALPALPTLPAVDCVIKPYRETDQSSPVAGVLKEVLVERSEPVSSGQVVAMLDASVETAAVELAAVRSDIVSDIEEQSVNLEYDRLRQQRMDSLYQRNTASKDLKEQAEREARLTDVRLQQARDLKRSRELELSRAKAQLEQKTLRAPFDGFVLQRFKTPGEYVEEQPVLRIAQLDPLSVEAVLPIEYFGKIEVGMSALIYPDAVYTQARTAQVTVVDRFGNAASGTFGVRLQLPNANNELPAGLRCRLEFTR
jgi:RND family efflux transporter MFP subunit